MGSTDPGDPWRRLADRPPAAGRPTPTPYTLKILQERSRAARSIRMPTKQPGRRFRSSSRREAPDTLWTMPLDPSPSVLGGVETLPARCSRSGDRPHQPRRSGSCAERARRGGSCRRPQPGPHARLLCSLGSPPWPRRRPRGGRPQARHPGLAPAARRDRVPLVAAEPGGQEGPRARAHRGVAAPPAGRSPDRQP